jgi:hypothetical protein
MEEASASFCEQKEAKKLYFIWTEALQRPRPRGAKVFCFFFSKKKLFLS